MIAGVFMAFLVAGCSRGAPGGGSRDGGDAERAVAVEVAPVERRPVELRRTFTGALQPESRVVVAPKVAGRIERITVDLADPVERGQAVAYLDAAEFLQEVRQAEAELAVSQALLRQAANELEISRRENSRVMALRAQGIASEAEYDVAQSDLMQKEGQLEVARAQVSRAEAALESARIRHGYTVIRAEWSEGDSLRRVAERYVDEGQTVSANEPLFLIVELDPIVAVITVTERDYGRLRNGQEALIMTDAVPGRSFTGRIARIAPVFREASRQARVELLLPNPDHVLRPGMFVRATVTLERVEDAIVVPEAALTRRADVDGVFRVREPDPRVEWVPVRAGIRADGMAQVVEPPDLDGRVVILGQHLLDDGSTVIIADPEADSP